MPERFDLSYTGADNADHRPVMIHRALLGSMERFAGILIEHHAGRFPLWLAPVQALILPVADRHIDYAQRGRRGAARRRRPGRGRRALGVGRQEDPRRRAGTVPVHARRRRPRGRRRGGLGPPPRRGRPGRDGVAEKFVYARSRHLNICFEHDHAFTQLHCRGANTSRVPLSVRLTTRPRSAAS